MEDREENNPKRQKIEEETGNNFWSWYIPHSAHPKSMQSEMRQVWFRFDSTWRLYRTLVNRKWHLRWYMIEILKVSPHQMGTFERLRAQGAFKNKLYESAKKVAKLEFWEQ